MILEDSIEIYLEANNDTNIKIKYDSEVQQGDSKISSETLQINQNNNKFKCSSKSFNRDNDNSNNLLIECNPETKIILNFLNTKGDVDVMIDSETNSSIREKTKNTNCNDLKSAQNIIQNYADIEINEMNMHNLNIRDGIGVDIYICSDNANSKQNNVKYESQQESKVSKLFIGGFDKKSNYIDLDIVKPLNTVLHTNNDKINVTCNDKDRDKLIHIQTLEDQIICKPNNCYINKIIKDLRIVLKPVIEELIKKNKKEYLKDLTEFIVSKILENINQHIEINKDTSEFHNQALSKCLRMNKTQKTFIAILSYISREIPSRIISKEILECVKNIAVKTIQNHKNSDTNSIQLQEQNTENYIKSYLAPRGFLQPITNLMQAFNSKY